MTRAPRGELSAAALELLAADLEVGLAVLDEDACYLFINPMLARLYGLPDGASSDERAPQRVSDQNETVIRGVIDRVRRTGAPVRGLSIEHDGRSWEASYVPLEVAGRFAVGVVAIDASAREAALANAALSASRHAALAEFSRTAVLAEDLEPLLDEAVALLMHELDVELAEVLELLPGGLELSLRTSFGYRLPEDGGVVIPAGAASQAGYTLSVSEPVVVEDLDADTRFSPSALLVDHGVHSGITVPIRAGPVLWGVLGAHGTRARTFAPADVYVVRTVANVLGAALAREAANVELRMLALQRRRLAKEALESVDRERRRLADVLHDDVLQHLLFARQECASLVSVATEPAVARLRKSLDDATRLLRGAVSDLHPVTLAHLGLRVTVESLAREYAERGGFKVIVRVAEERPTRHDQLVVTAVRELLTNVVKHSGASSVHVIVRSAAAELVIEVSDDGVGLDPAALQDAIAGGHVGLASLLERVEAMGGRGELTTAWDGRGGRVCLALPLP